MKRDLEKRRATQPYTEPTFGSTFRNPPGDHAGRLIEAVGLKGHRLGGAEWSTVHANFVVNAGGATARDVLGLVRLARARVREAFGIALEPEVRLAGEFAPGETPL
jgi:UDP-N-acetylmuramate dehydrogenase